MTHIQKITHKEKVKMFNKLTKKELIEMLIASNEMNELLARMNQPAITTDPVYPTYPYNNQPFCGTCSDGNLTDTTTTTTTILSPDVQISYTN